MNKELGVVNLLTPEAVDILMRDTLWGRKYEIIDDGKYFVYTKDGEIVPFDGQYINTENGNDANIRKTETAENQTDLSINKRKKE